ncbi:hypothetical protein pipiens_016549 [Culex pipiens pipiens]|uniref:DUF4780 domain-containing protein n=1 Tax=Culex pipiens pipiens TaxID=38569 RepID=A0ABD1CL61_CULPP
MEKQEEIREDGLQSKSLEEIDSCSSSILDSEEEDDGINITIKAVTPGVAADGSADLVEPKLAGSERRKMNKKIEGGMKKEEARSSVISSTPKRSRNTSLNSPNGGTVPNPVPKKVCAEGSAATKKVNDGGSNVSAQEEDDVVMNEVAVDEKSANGDVENKEVEEEEAGGLPGPSGSAGTPTYQQIASRIKLGIVPASYPDAELTSEQQDAVKEVLLKKVLEQRKEQFKPKFVYCKSYVGLVMLLCQENSTANWVKMVVSSISPWENAVLSAVDEADIPRKEVLRGYFYRSKNDENDTVLGYLESQNDNLDTSAWRILRRSGKNDHVEWAFTIDTASMKLLEEQKFVVNYKFGQTMFRRKQAENRKPSGR